MQDCHATRHIRSNNACRQQSTFIFSLTLTCTCSLLLLLELSVLHPVLPSLPTHQSKSLEIRGKAALATIEVSSASGAAKALHSSRLLPNFQHTCWLLHIHSSCRLLLCCATTFAVAFLADSLQALESLLLKVLQTLQHTALRLCNCAHQVVAAACLP